MIHIDCMFQFEQSRSKHDLNCSSLKYASETLEFEFISAMIDYDDFKEKVSTHREVNKINFVILFSKNSDDSTVLLNVMKTRKR